MKYHLAQVNIARMKFPLDDPRMAEFVARIPEINALAETSPGFIWRFQTDAGNALYTHPYDDDRILFNMSVWESVEALKTYAYRSQHVEVFRKRQNWFDPLDQAGLALWWVPAGHLPGIDEAKKRLARLDQAGPTQFAFTFKRVFEPDDGFQQSIDWSSFEPCPAAT
jgi:hypothetical protein